MISVVNYKHKLHSPHLASLLTLRKMDHQLLGELPKIGYIAYSDGCPAALGFLRKTEGSYGLFDGLISNPALSSNERHEALERVVQAIVIKAKSMKIKKIFGWTMDKSTLVRASRHGFLVTGQQLITLSV